MLESCLSAFSRAYGTVFFFLGRFPPLKRRAIVKRPLRDGG